MPESLNIRTYTYLLNIIGQSTVPIQSLQTAKHAPSFPEVYLHRSF